MKYRHCDGSLVLKITDDKVVSVCGLFEVRVREGVSGHMGPMQPLLKVFSENRVS